MPPKRNIERLMNDPEYLEKRRKNNEAVNKSRKKRRHEDAETRQRVEQLQVILFARCSTPRATNYSRCSPRTRS